VRYDIDNSAERTIVDVGPEFPASVEEPIDLGADLLE